MYRVPKGAQKLALIWGEIVLIEFTFRDESNTRFCTQGNFQFLFDSSETFSTPRPSVKSHFGKWQFAESKQSCRAFFEL
jgi:hypothetical protein